MDWRRGSRPPRLPLTSFSGNILRTPRGPPTQGQASSSSEAQGSVAYRGRGRGSSSFNYVGQPFCGSYHNSSRGGHSNTNPNRHQSSKGLDLHQLTRLAEPNKEPSEIIRLFNNSEEGLNSVLLDNPNDFERLELILLALGGFCKENGATQFSGGFVSIVHVLAKHRVFSQVTGIIIQISVSPRLSSEKEDRLRRLISAVYHLATEMIVMVPAFACNFL